MARHDPRTARARAATIPALALPATGATTDAASALGQVSVTSAQRAVRGEAELQALSTTTAGETQAPARTMAQRLTRAAAAHGAGGEGASDAPDAATSSLVLLLKVACGAFSPRLAPAVTVHAAAKRVGFAAQSSAPEASL